MNNDDNLVTPKTISKKSIFVRISVFVVLFIVLFIGANYLFQPVYYDWNNYDATHDIYDEPDNTIQAAFFGASITDSGITPMEIYEKYGFCTYNMGTEQQSIFSAYHWLKEIYAHNPKTLKTAIMDIANVRYIPSESLDRKALDQMKLNMNKFSGFYEYTNKDLQETISYSIPLFAYHSRWSELGKRDTTKYVYTEKDYLRGYGFYPSTSYFKSYTAEQYALPIYYRNLEDVSEAQFSQENLYFLKEMIDFCDEHDIKLVFYLTPRNLSSEQYKTIENLCANYDIDLLDLSRSPLIDEIDYNMAIDTMDGGHPNYYGASKISNFLGKYLSENCEVEDVRGKEGYEYLDIQLENYNKYVKNVVNSYNVTDVVDYLKLFNGEDYSIFISVKDDAASGLTDFQRLGFKSLGLDMLSNIDYRESYIGIIENGEVAYEQTQANPGEDVVQTVEVNNSLEGVTYDTFEEERNKTEALATDKSYKYLEYKGELNNYKAYKIQSGGAFLGNVSSIIIDDKEYSYNTRGINIVVYDNVRQEVISQRTFDTCASSVSEPDYLLDEYREEISKGIEYNDLSDSLKKLYKFDKRCENSKISSLIYSKIGNDGLLEYLDYYLNLDKDIAIFLSISDEGSYSLTDEVRDDLNNLGLTTLSNIELYDSYVGIIHNGEVIYEERSSSAEEDPISYECVFDTKYDGKIVAKVESANAGVGWYSKTYINNVNYSVSGRGINIVVWDLENNLMVSQTYFDTYAVEQKGLES